MLVDEYRKGWALRYIREAKAQIAAARTSPDSMPSLIVDALRKAQTAVYYSLGDPLIMEKIVMDALNEDSVITDPVLRCLVELERSIEIISNMPISAAEEALNEADEIVKVAAEIVSFLVGSD